MKKVLYAILSVLAFMGVPVPSHAALDLTGVTVDTAPAFAMALIVIGALAAMWVIYKVISLLKAK